MGQVGRRESARKTGPRRGGKAARAAAVLAASLVLFLGLCVGFSPPALAGPFSELPPDHWSFAALASLVPPGLLSAPVLESYRTRPGVMRFEVALLVAQAVRTLAAADPAVKGDPFAPEKFERLLAAYRVAGPGKEQGRPLSAAEASALRRLASEYAPELEILGVTGTPVAAAEPLALPSPADGPFVDLDVLASSGSIQAPAVAAASPAPNLLPAPAPILPDKPGPLAAGITPPQVTLAPQRLTGDVPGLAAGETAAVQQPLQGSVPVPKPAWMVNAQVEGERTKLPLPKLDLSLTPALRVTGALAPDPAEGREPSGSVQVEATVNVGGVAVGANVRSNEQVRPGVTPPPDQELKVGVVPATKAAGMSLRVGPVGFSSDVAEITKDESAKEVEHRRQFDLEYAFGRRAQVRAGYSLVDLDTLSPADKSRTDASVGVNVSLSETAKLSASLTLEGLRSWWPADGATGQRANAGVELRLPWRTFLTAGYEYYRPTDQAAQGAAQSATTLGVGYNFADNATLLLGYQLIDFGTNPNQTEVQAWQHNLTAGVSFRF